MGKKYRGNHPHKTEGWKLVGEIIDNRFLVWLVYRRAQKHSAEWADYKTVAADLAENKANYWLSRNNQTGKNAFTKDFGLMKKTRPELADRLDALIKDLESLL